jgi:hypothetical protein
VIEATEVDNYQQIVKAAELPALYQRTGNDVFNAVVQALLMKNNLAFNGLQNGLHDWESKGFVERQHAEQRNAVTV